MNDAVPTVIDNPWAVLRGSTDARIALGRAGVSLPTAAHLDFQQAHAEARDAVRQPLDVPRVMAALRSVLPGDAAPCLRLHSAAPDRDTYLQRPDLGRRLDEASRERLAQLPRFHDLSFVVADGLSARAIEHNAAPLLGQFLRRPGVDAWSIAPVCVVEQGRVAVGDDVAARLGAKLVVVLIGERPGLSSPDSMGLYLTWMPRAGMTDADRNCISNVRPAGLGPADAARVLHQLVAQAMQRQLSGVLLKDESEGG